MKPPEFNYLENQIIEQLRTEPSTARYLANSLSYSETHIRNHLTALVENGIIVSKRHGKDVIYSVSDQYERNEPLLRYSNGSHFGYIYTGQIAVPPQKETKAIAAARFVGQLATELTNEAYKLQLLKEQRSTLSATEYDKALKRTKKRLRELKIRALAELNNLGTAYGLLQQMLQHNNLWNFEELSLLASPQISKDGALLDLMFDPQESATNAHRYQELEENV